MFFFFFSSRRRHTRWTSDWSSDVCSSDLAEDEEMRELIVINKADAMIAIERSGPEVQALPTIVMRRRSLRHVYLAAYALVFKYRIEKELKRATFYAQLALQTAEEANEVLWKIGALNELGSIYDAD